MNISQALKNLDALDDDQWTADGVPKIDVVSEMVGSKVTRQEIINVAPEFSKSNMVIPEKAAAEKAAAADEEPEVDLSLIREYLEGDPLPEQKFVPFLNEVSKNSLEALEMVLSEQLDEAEKAIRLAEDLKNRVKRSLAFTRSRIKTEMPDVSNQQAIQLFIKSQAEARGARAAKAKEILKGVDIKDLDPRSAIDRAMARKSGRGTTRPARPRMG
jgi:hypothetical protein